MAYAMRPAAWDDIDAVVALIGEADRVDYGAATYTKSDVAGDWQRARVDIAADTRLFQAEDGAIAGYAYVWPRDPGKGQIVLLGLVHPEHRGRGLGARMVDWMEARAAERLAAAPGAEPVLTTIIPSEDGAAAALFSSRGYEESRRFWRMEVALARGRETPADPPGIVIEQVQPDLNAARIHEVMQDAFSRHWRYVYEPYEDWRDRHIGRGDVPLWFVAYASGEAVGALVGWVEERQGRVDQIGVRAPFRRRGVAATLLLRAFAAFAEAGATGADLEVDSENRTGATALYEHVGMHVSMTHVFLQKKQG